MLKIVYPICCGIDVHKTFIVATIASTNEKNLTTYETARFSTFTKDLLRFVQWLQSRQCTNVCMESTGKYWIPVFNILEPHCHIILAHPKLSALVILFEIGADMSKFPSANHLTSWAGLTPCNDQSAGKKKSTQISRAGCYIKPVHVQYALAAINDKANPFFGIKYQALKNVAVTRKRLLQWLKRCFPSSTPCCRTENSTTLR